MRLLITALLLTVLLQPTLKAQSPPARETYKGFGFTAYDSRRADYEAMPIHVIAMGGRPGPNGKGELYIAGLRNEATKDVNAVRFAYYIFNDRERDQLLSSKQLDLITIDLKALQEKTVDIQLIDMNDIDFFASKPPGRFVMEVGACEVHFTDGSTWTATGAPQKRILSATNQRTNP